jgi:hypothetical protein
MADIDPYAQLAVTQLTPRSPNLVDQVSEAKRIAEAILRANPLYNARVDGGLMVWRGNYAGTGGINDSYLWIGEVTPMDLNLNKTQRGVFITRDDPKHARVLWVYDSSPEAGVPLRQTMTMHDADDRPLLREGNGGGAAWPYGMIPLYPQNAKFETVKNSAGVNEPMPLLAAQSSATSSSFENIWEGRGPQVGNRVKFEGAIITTSSGPTIEGRVVFTWDDPLNTVYTSPVVSVPSFNFFTHYLEIDTRAIFPDRYLVGYEVQVQWQGRTAAGSYKWSFMYPHFCYSFAS